MLITKCGKVRQPATYVFDTKTFLILEEFNSWSTTIRIDYSSYLVKRTFFNIWKERLKLVLYDN